MEEYKLYYLGSNTYKVFKNGTIINNATNKILNGQSLNGYKRVCLRSRKEGIVKCIMVHRLVAECFIPNPNPVFYTEINHKDCNRANNNVENLEWCTHSENIKYAAELKHYNTRGSKNPNAKLTEEQVNEIRRLRNTTKLTLQNLVNMFNVSNGMIQKIVYNKNWL